MIRIQDFLKLPKEEMLDLVVGKEICQKSRVLFDLGITGNSLCDFCTGGKNKIMKKTHCWITETYSFGELKSIEISNGLGSVSVELSGRQEILRSRDKSKDGWILKQSADSFVVIGIHKNAVHLRSQL